MFFTLLPLHSNTTLWYPRYPNSNGMELSLPFWWRWFLLLLALKCVKWSAGGQREVWGPDRKGLIKIISTRYFLVIKEINKYLVDMILINYFRSGDAMEPWGRVCSQIFYISMRCLCVYFKRWPRYIRQILYIRYATICNQFKSMLSSNHSFR
jgi:hypothetical protein